MELGLFIWKLLLVPLDLFAFTMLTSWVTGRFDWERKQVLLGMGALLLQAGALFTRSDEFSLCVTFGYVFLSICLKTHRGRLRAFGNTLVLIFLFVCYLVLSSCCL